MELIISKKKVHLGFGLVELMVAILLSSLLGAAVVQAYLASKNTFALRDAQSETLENGRFAINHIVENIQSAGAAGCNNIDGLTFALGSSTQPAPGGESGYRSVINSGSASTNAGDSGGVVYAPDSIIRGYSNVAVGNAFSAVPGTDVLIIRRLSNESAQLAVSMVSPSSDIVISKGAVNPSIGDPIVIADCNRAILFRVSDKIDAGAQITLKHTTAGGFNTQNDFPSLDGTNPTYFSLPSTSVDSRTYGGGQVMSFDSITYSIRNTLRTTKKGLPIFGLFESRLGSGGGLAATELVAGVESMKLEYGLKNSAGVAGPITSYVTADNVPDWGRVVSVRINLLLQSTADSVVGSAASPQAQTLTFPLVTTAAGATAATTVAQDGRLRHAIFTIATIRNRTQLGS